MKGAHKQNVLLLLLVVASPAVPEGGGRDWVGRDKLTKELWREQF